MYWVVSPMLQIEGEYDSFEVVVVLWKGQLQGSTECLRAITAAIIGCCCCCCCQKSEEKYKEAWNKNRSTRSRGWATDLFILYTSPLNLSSIRGPITTSTPHHTPPQTKNKSHSCQTKMTTIIHPLTHCEIVNSFSATLQYYNRYRTTYIWEQMI